MKLKNYKNLENHLKLLKPNDKENLLKLKDQLTPLKDKEYKKLPIEYSMLLISFSQNNSIDKAIEMERELINLNYIDDNSIKQLAEKLYLWLKVNKTNTENKGIKLFP